MVSPVVVDSDTLIDYFGGHAPSADAVDKLLRADRLAITAISLFELRSGARTAAQRTDIDTVVQASRTLPLDVSAAMEAGTLYQRLRARGELLDTADLLIAACCLSRGYPLLMRNRRHFERIDSLQLLSAQSVLDSDSE